VSTVAQARPLPKSRVWPGVACSGTGCVTTRNTTDRSQAQPTPPNAIDTWSMCRAPKMYLQVPSGKEGLRIYEGRRAIDAVLLGDDQRNLKRSMDSSTKPITERGPQIDVAGSQALGGFKACTKTGCNSRL